MVARSMFEELDAFAVDYVKVAMLAMRIVEETMERPLRRYRSQTGGWPPVKRVTPLLTPDGEYFKVISMFLPEFLIGDRS